MATSKTPSHSTQASKRRGLLSYLLPAWLLQYRKSQFIADILAGIVVGVLVIPQSLGYAVLAGLPPEYGLYASIVPVLVYAWFGSSNFQAVGPVAITAIMTASSLSGYADKGVVVYASMASLLAVMVGLILWLAGRLKFGWIMQFISRGVASGFVSGAAVLIFISQLKYFTAIPFSGNTLFSYLSSMFANIAQLHNFTVFLGGVGFVLLLLNKYGNKWVWKSWLQPAPAKWVERLFPLCLVIVFILCSDLWHWADKGVPVIGNTPSGLPNFSLPYVPSLSDFFNLLPTAALMALIAFVSSSSIAGFYARKHGQKFDANAELTGLGWANLIGGFFQSFAVAGGFSRTAINDDSGAKTPLASIVTVLVMLFALLLLGNLISPLPYALLGAIIMASIIGLIDYPLFRHAWRVDRLDAINLVVTFFAVLLLGLNSGLIIGLLVSFASLIWQSSNPHIATVGVLKDTEHFRNVNRHNVQTFDNLLFLRIDESLFFGNSDSVQHHIIHCVEKHPQACDIILIMSAVNHVDLTAQEMLIELNADLIKQQKRLHFSEIKGPVMDVLAETKVIKQLSGHVFLSTIKAVDELKSNNS
ncbi:SulP family inorganic anion transporter [Psychrobacter sp. HD31]|uniref:SulP family inorganic anion transporter n=1 Tax=Psychrobacter sp. HD31 TaxID=3112003 RepID=UPI003DA2E954